VREIVQEIALLGLGRTPFYEHAAFYGGSALRIFHGLQRFSEDLDFSLLQPKAGFSLKPYLGAVADELTASAAGQPPSSSWVATRYRQAEGPVEEHRGQTSFPNSVYWIADH
jgi:hypothetical protein